MPNWLMFLLSILVIIIIIRFIMFMYAATGGCLKWGTYGLFLTKIQCIEYKPFW